MITKMPSNITNSIQTIILAIITIVGFYLVFKQIKNLEIKFQKNKKENDEIINNIFNLINTQNFNRGSVGLGPSLPAQQEPTKAVTAPVPAQEWNNEKFMTEDFSSDSDSDGEIVVTNDQTVEKSESDSDSDVEVIEDVVLKKEEEEAEEEDDEAEEEEASSNNISKKYTKEELSNYKLKDIKDICRDLNIQATGSKENLINKILNINNNN